jgi:hypothetical protein
MLTKNFPHLLASLYIGSNDFCQIWTQNDEPLMEKQRCSHKVVGCELAVRTYLRDSHQDPFAADMTAVSDGHG